MSPLASQVLHDALALAPAERAVLVDELLGSFDLDERQRLDALWAVEAEARVDAYERGDLAALPARDALRQARSAGS